MNFWTELVDAAVLGRRADLPSPPPSLAGLARNGSTSDGAALLRLAAVASRARRACYSQWPTWLYPTRRRPITGQG